MELVPEWDICLYIFFWILDNAKHRVKSIANNKKNWFYFFFFLVLQMRLNVVLKICYVV